jgi:hypothetical protein
VLHAIQIIAIVLTALAMAPAIAHAFEFPGKKRLDKQGYVAVQAIYYPGFTLLGITEPGALIAIVIMLFLMPRHGWSSLLVALALLCTIGMQAIYWLITHPTNKHWLANSSATLGKTGNRFFAVGPAAYATDWTKLRDRWEYSHILRAGLAFASFVLVTISAVTSS